MFSLQLSQGGYTQYALFLFLWDTRADKQHYVEHTWPARCDVEPMFTHALVNPQNILLPRLNIKLRIQK